MNVVSRITRAKDQEQKQDTENAHKTPTHQTTHNKIKEMSFHVMSTGDHRESFPEDNRKGTFMFSTLSSLVGIEPTTFGLEVQRAIRCARGTHVVGQHRQTIALGYGTVQAEENALGLGLELFRHVASRLHSSFAHW